MLRVSRTLEMSAGVGLIERTVRLLRLVPIFRLSRQFDLDFDVLF